MLAAAALSHFGVNARGLISVAFVVALVVLAAIDLRYRVIPNRLVAPAAAAILLAQLAFFPGDAVEWILAGLGAGLIMLLPALKLDWSGSGTRSCASCWGWDSARRCSAPC